jgi:hypothetical protein
MPGILTPGGDGDFRFPSESGNWWQTALTGPEVSRIVGARRDRRHAVPQPPGGLLMSLRHKAWAVGCRRLAPDAFNNEMTTAANLTSSIIGIYLYDNDNCTGTSVYIPSGARRDYSSSTFNNKASSIRVVYF